MKKKNTAKRKARKAALVILPTIAILLIAGVAIYFFATREKEYKVTGADGKQVSLTAAEMLQALTTETFYTGTQINGVDVSGKTKAEVTAMFAADPALDTPNVQYTLTVQGSSYPLDGTSLGITSDLSSVIDEAYAYARIFPANSSADPSAASAASAQELTPTAAVTAAAEAVPTDASSLIEQYNAMTLLATQPKNFTSAYKADPAAAATAVDALLTPLEKDVQNATATSFDVNALSFVITDSTEGISFDKDSVAADVIAAVQAGEYTKTFTVDPIVIEPTITADMLKANLGLVSTTTTTTTDVANRNTNIRLICEKIDGLVLQPGESFNFNDYVGERTAAKGYLEAGGIYDGQLRQELGGGICQANGTLYHSVLEADLQVDERHPHTWPSTYVDTGTDATVTWGGKNFQFTNNTDYPIAIHAYYANRKVTVAIYGRPVADGMTIDVIGIVKSDTPPGPPEYVADITLPAGKTAKDPVRGAHDAITAECYKVYYKDGTEVKRVLVDTSYYPAITAKIGVGVLAPDGVTQYPLDPKTGVVTIPSPTPTPTSTPSPTPDPTEVPAAE